MTSVLAPRSGHGHGQNLFCPPNRELALMGQIKQGWSTMSPRRSSQKEFQLDRNEVQHILDVMAKADALEKREEIRIGVQMLNYKQLQEHAMGDGVANCILCGLDFANQRSRKQISIQFCQECGKAVCNRCKTAYTCHSGEVVTLCRLCNEKRELWKKSGAWLRNALPVITVPQEELESQQRLQQASQALTRFESIPTDFRAPSQEEDEGDDEADYDSYGDSASIDFTVRRSLPSSREGSLERVALKHPWKSNEGTSSWPDTYLKGGEKRQSLDLPPGSSGIKRSSPGTGGRFSRKRRSQRAVHKKEGEQMRRRLRQKTAEVDSPSPPDSRENTPPMNESADDHLTDLVSVPQPPAIKVRKATPPSVKTYGLDIGPAPQGVCASEEVVVKVEESSSPEPSQTGTIGQRHSHLDSEIIPIVEYSQNGEDLDTPWDVMLSQQRAVYSSGGDLEEEKSGQSPMRRKPVPTPRHKNTHEAERVSQESHFTQETFDGFKKVQVATTPPKSASAVTDEFSKVVVPSSPKEVRAVRSPPLVRQMDLEGSAEFDEFLQRNTAEAKTRSSSTDEPKKTLMGSARGLEHVRRAKSAAESPQQSLSSSWSVGHSQVGRATSSPGTGSPVPADAGDEPEGYRFKRQPARRVSRMKRPGSPSISSSASQLSYGQTGDDAEVSPQRHRTRSGAISGGRRGRPDRAPPSSTSQLPHEQTGDDGGDSPYRHRTRSGAISGGRRGRPDLGGDSSVGAGGGRLRSNTGDSVASTTSSLTSSSHSLPSLEMHERRPSYEDFLVSEHGERS